MVKTYGSLFSGIGGLDLGLERAGFTATWQVEIDDYATQVLQKHWPNVTRFRDIRTVGKHNLTPVDLICGGFPCQPHSLAGKRQASGDERDLWGEFYRVICETQPRWVVAENVPGLLSSEDGRFFGRVLRDMASCGYDVQWNVLSAAAFGAPHIRERVFIVANATSKQGERVCQRAVQPNNTTGTSHAPHSDLQRLQGLWTQKVQRVETFSWCQNIRSIEDLRNRPDIPEPLIRGNRHGVPCIVDRLRCLGNAVVPQVAEYVGKCILAKELAAW